MKIVTPESVGISASPLNEIDTAMQALIDQGKFAGIATLIARYGKVAHFGCYGKLDLALDKPIQANSLFRIQSLTKPITAVAVLILYDEGHFDLDDPVSKWVPEFKNFKVMKDSTDINSELVDLEKEITFRHLLTHTSGLCYGYKEITTEAIDEIYRDSGVIGPIHLVSKLPLQEFIQKLTELPLATQPGTRFRYSLAFEVLGYLVGLISGKPFDVFLRERIFEPLGMHDTSFVVPQGKIERFGPLYRAPNETGLSVLDDVATSDWIRPDRVTWGGGGLVSSMPDYLRFMLMLANGGELDGVRILKLDTVTAMTTNQLGANMGGPAWNSSIGYGLGVGVSVAGAPRFGWLGISGTMAWFYPRKEMLVMAMPQAHFNFEASDTLLRIAREVIAPDVSREQLRRTK